MLNKELKESFLVKCGVTYDKPFFLYKGKMWIETDKDIARGNTYGFCSFDEKLLNNEIKPEEILAISFNKAMTILEEAFLENQSLVKVLEKILERMNKEMIDLRKESQDLKSRSCVTCKYGHTYQFDEDIECMKLGADTQGLYFEKDFYCKNWELKNERD